MENKNSLFIRKYITLVESINNKLITGEKVLNEDLIASAAREGKLIASELEAYLKIMMKDTKIADELIKSGIRTSEELLLALKGNKLSNTLKGALELGVLKSNTKNAKLIDLASENLVRNKLFDKKYATEFAKGQPAYESALKNAGYSDDAITKIVQKKFNQIDPKTGKPYKRPETIKKGDVDISTKKTDTGKVGKDAGKVGKEGTAIADDVAREIETGIKTTNETKNIFIFIKDYIKEIKVTIINNIRNFTIPNKLLAWLLVGGGLIVLYNLLKGSGGEIVIKDENGKIIDPNKLEGWAQCMQNLIKNNQGELTKSSKGNPVVKVTKTGNSEYDALGGLLFFTDYTVLSMDGRSKKGKWKCKSGQVQPMDEKYLNEQATNNMPNDVSVMIDLLDFPVTKNDLVQANNLLQKYVTNGQGKEFLNLYNDSGLADASLETSLNYIATFDPASVQAKNQMYDKIKQIKTGKGGQGKPTNTGDPLSGIEITWDDGKPTPTQKPIPENNYRDCNNFPLFFGCKGKLVSDLQTCLKMTSTDGKFGPATKAAAESWAKSNNITLKAPINAPGGGVYETFGVTEENFNKICGGTEPIKPTPTPNVQDPLTPTPTPNVQEPVKKDDGEELYSRLLRQSDIEQRTRNKIVYKGPQLTPEEQSLLVKYMKSSGFEPKKPNERRRDWKRGDRIVFERTGSYDEE